MSFPGAPLAALALASGCLQARPATAVSPRIATVVVPPSPTLDTPRPESHDAEGPPVPELAWPAPLDPSLTPANIPAGERAPELRAALLEPQNPHSAIQVSCSDGRCWMLPGGDRGGQCATYLYRRHARAAKPPVELVSALRLDERSEALELRELWVDKLTLGTRLARRTLLPLTAVGQAGATRVYAFRQGEQLLAVIPLRGAVWAYDDQGGTGDVARLPVTSCDLGLFPLASGADASPLVLVGPVKTTQTASEPTPYAGPQLEIEIRAERAAADQPAHVRVTSESRLP